MGWIYLIRNKINNKCYVGQTVLDKVSKRWSQHKSRPHGCLAFAFQKYGIDNFEFSTLLEITKCENLKELLNEKEIFEIKERNTLSPNGYNLETGGTAGRTRHPETREKTRIKMKGKKHTDETKLKISESNKGRPVTQETRQKISDHHTGRPLSEQVKLSMSKSRKGRIISDETKKKISISESGKRKLTSKNNKAVEQYSLDEKLIKTFPSITDARLETKILHKGISKCCRGVIQTSGGFKWRYAP